MIDKPEETHISPETNLTDSEVAVSVINRLLGLDSRTNSERECLNDALFIIQNNP